MLKTMVRAIAALALSVVMGAAASAEDKAPAAPAAPAEAAAPERLVFAFQKQKDPQAIRESADSLGRELSERLKMPVDVMIPASYSLSVQALVSNKAQVAYVSAIPFLLARREAPVGIALAEVRDDMTAYTSIFVVRADSPLKTVADLRGQRMMFTSPTSTSGYIMPYSRLVNEKLLPRAGDPGTFFSQVGFAGGYDRALLSVMNGQADVCAVSDYTMTGPKADKYLNAEQRAKLRILDRTPGVPTHLVCLRTDLPAELRESVTAALLAISEEKPALLSDVYGAARFARVNEQEHVAKAVEALENTGLVLDKLMD